MKKSTETSSSNALHSTLKLLYPLSAFPFLLWHAQ